MGQVEVPFVRRKVPNLEITRLASCVCSLTSGCITERNGQNDHIHTQTHIHKHIHSNTYTQEVWPFTRITRPVYGLQGLANGNLSNFLRPTVYHTTSLGNADLIPASCIRVLGEQDGVILNKSPIYFTTHFFQPCLHKWQLWVLD